MKIDKNKNEEFTKMFNKRILELNIDERVFCEVLLVTQSRFKAWIRGEMPTRKNLINICKILKVDPNQFIDEEAE